MNVLYVAWRSGDIRNGAWGPVGRLDYDGEVFRFCYTRGARTLPDFRPFAQMDDLDRIYESEQLFPLFENRLLSPSRPEYHAFLTWSGFSPDNPPDPLVILGVTEGIRQTDAVEVFPCPIPDSDGCYINKFFLHGIRWSGADALALINELLPGERLCLNPEPTNQFDPNAVAIYTAGMEAKIGYIPRYLAKDVKELLLQCNPDWIQLFVLHANREAPLQQRLLCEMHSCWPDCFRPCSGEEFQPIPEVAPVVC